MVYDDTFSKLITRYLDGLIQKQTMDTDAPQEDIFFLILKKTEQEENLDYTGLTQ